MFKVKSNIAWGRTRAEMRRNIADDLIASMAQELLGIRGYYDGVTKTLRFDEAERKIGSTDWAAAILNQGRLRGTYVPLNILIEWVQKYKEPTATKHQAYTAALKINQKIYNEGIDPTWYVEDALNDIGAESV